MVLDLVVEPAHEVVHHVAAADVAAGQHLATKEVDLRPARQDRHALVVRRERCPHVEAEDGQLNADEREGHAERQEAEDHGEVADVAHCQQHDLQSALVDLAGREDRLERVEVKVQTLGQEHGEEQPPLSLGEEAREALQARRVVLLEDDEVRLDVRILVDGVGIRVMAGVLAHPPGVADADDQVGHDPAGEFVELARFEHLAVRQLVGDERVLGEEDPERAGDQQRVPRVLKHREAEPRGNHGDRDDAEGDEVEAPAAAQQASIPNRVQQCGELAQRVRHAARASLDDAYGFAGYCRSHVASKGSNDFTANKVRADAQMS